MITASRIVGTYGATLTFTLSGADDGGVQIDRFSWSPRLAGEELPNPDQSGAMESYVQLNSQFITIAGRIIGAAGAATSTVTQLNTFADAVLPDAGDQTDFNHGTLYVTFAGQSEVYCPFVCTRWEPAIEVIGGAVMPYEVELRNPNGFFRFTSGDAVFKL